MEQKMPQKVTWINSQGEETTAEILPIVSQEKLEAVKQLLIDSHLRSLVGEKGREEIATILRAYRLHVTELNSRKEQPLFNKAVDALADLEEALDSLLPIIGSMVKEREEELRKEGRQEVVEWVNKAYPIIKIYPNWQAQLKLWGVQKEGTKNE